MHLLGVSADLKELMAVTKAVSMNTPYILVIAITFYACMSQVSGESVSSVIYDNGSPDFLVAHVSDTDQPLQQAGDFILPVGANRITGVRFHGLYGSTFGGTPPEPLAADDFTVRFFEDDSGKPASDWLHEFRVGDISRASVGFPPQPPFNEYFLYEAEIPEIELSAGQTYWLSVFNSTESDERWNWFWARSRVGGYWQRRTIDGEEWDHPRLFGGSIHYYESAFQLIGVPEPSSSTLLGCGVLLFLELASRYRR